MNTFNVFSCRTDYFKSSFLPSVVTEWNKLNPDVPNCSSADIFRNALLNQIRPVAIKT